MSFTASGTTPSFPTTTRIEIVILGQILIVCDGAKIPSAWLSSENRIRINHYQGDIDLTLKIENLSRALHGQIADHGNDLVRIASYAYAADQSVKRWTPTDADDTRWVRRFSMCVPVNDPAFWEQAPVKAALIAALSFVSEDHWDFAFSLGGPPEQLMYVTGATAFSGNPDLVVMFSGGADSLCATVDTVATGRRPLLASHWATPPTSSLQAHVAGKLRGWSSLWEFPQVSSRIHRMGSDAVEDTQRTRSFLCASLGAAIAASLDLDEVLLADNGIVSINLPINAGIKGVQASRSTHPKFLFLFRKLAGLVFGRPINLHNPLWDKTRTECLQLLRQHDAQQLLASTISCGRTRLRTTDQPHCGGCSQCVGRRFAAIDAGMEDCDPASRYVLDIFTHDLPEGEIRTTAVSFVRSAREIVNLSDHALFEKFGQLFDCLPEDIEVERTASALCAMIRRQASSILQVAAHQVEAHSFELVSGTLPPASLLRLLVADGTVVGEAPSSPTPGFVHADDYTWVTWREQTFTFTGQQSKVMGILHRAHRGNAPTVSWQQIKDQLESYPARMSDIFKDSPAWNTLILQVRRGMYHLDL